MKSTVFQLEEEKFLVGVLLTKTSPLPSALCLRFLVIHAEASQNLAVLIALSGYDVPETNCLRLHAIGTRWYRDQINLLGVTLLLRRLPARQPQPVTRTSPRVGSFYA